MKLLLCILFGHDFRCHGFWRSFGDQMPPEHDEEWICSKCGDEPSDVFDNDNFIGRLKSWWYQE